MAQNTGTFAQLLKYSFKVIPEIRNSSGNIREMQDLCSLRKETSKKLNEESYSTSITGPAGFAAAHFALHPCTDIKNTSAFIMALYSLANTLEAYCTTYDITLETEMRRVFNCLSGAIDPSRSTNCALRYITENPEGKKRAIPCLCDYCRLQLAVLPSFAQVAQKLKKYIQFYIDFKTYANYPFKVRNNYLENWSSSYIKRYREINWWEFCIASDSLLGIAAMYVSAQIPGLTSMEVQLLDEACFPWLTGLDSLLRSYTSSRIQNSGDLNLSAYYKNLHELESRILFFAEKAEETCKKLKYSSFYITLIRLLVTFYLSLPEADFGMNRIVTSNIRKKYLLNTGLQYNICKLIHQAAKSELTN